MRLNMVRAHARATAKAKLIKHLVHEFATEFDASHAGVWEHLRSGHSEFGEAFVQFFVNQGWRMQWYALPVPSVYNEHGVYTAISAGVCIADDCEHLVAWMILA